MGNDEEGEMFSNSYLSDMKAGRCSLGDNGGRISELARRNTMQPAHLKSSYPAETQFRPAEEFTDDDLRIGAIQKLADATSNLSVDSPALNTRRQSSIRMNISSRKSLRAESTPASAAHIIWKDDPKKQSKQTPADDATRTPPKLFKPITFEISPNVQPGVRPRKRQSMTKTDVENSIEAVKRPRKELSSYSKPGPPTPARRHNRSNNSSLNSSAKSVASMNISTLTTGSNVLETPAKVHDKTPLLDSTNKSNKSLRSLKTPLSLKKVMRSAFRKSKTKYDVKKSLDTPLKRA